MAGTLIGNIAASDEVILQSTGRVLGNIVTPVLKLENGAITKGDVTLTGGQAKDIPKLVRDSFSATPGYEHYTKGGKDKDKDKDKKKGEGGLL